MNPAAPRVSAAPQTSGKATSSLILGISSVVCWVFTGIPAIILGIVALRDIKRSNGQLQGDGLAIGGIVVGAISTFLIVPILILVALLLPAVDAAREAARRNMSMNNMRQIALALEMHHTLKRSLPTAGGGEGLSWRVHMLPYLEEPTLYEKFHLDEPWDSEHNRALISRMPDTFKDPNDRLPPGETSYLAVTGPGTAFGKGESGLTFQDFTDGASRTIMVVEADPDQSVAWTKPDDWQYDPANPTRGLSSSRPGGFLAAFADSSIKFIDDDTDPETVKAAMTRDGGEQLDLSQQPD